MSPRNGWYSSATRSTSAGVEAQCLLVMGGFDPGPIDGVFGKKSQAAMTAFQSAMNRADAGLAEDGFPGPKSWVWLRWDTGSYIR